MTGGSVDFDDRPEKTLHKIRDLSLATPFLSNLPWAGAIFVQPAFHARINGAPLDLHGKTRPFGPNRETSLDHPVLDAERAADGSINLTKMTLVSKGGRSPDVRRPNPGRLGVQNLVIGGKPEKAAIDLALTVNTTGKLSAKGSLVPQPLAGDFAIALALRHPPCSRGPAPLGAARRALTDLRLAAPDPIRPVCPIRVGGSVRGRPERLAIISGLRMSPRRLRHLWFEHDLLTTDPKGAVDDQAGTQGAK